MLKKGYSTNLQFKLTLKIVKKSQAVERKDIDPKSLFMFVFE